MDSVNYKECHWQFTIKKKKGSNEIRTSGMKTELVIICILFIYFLCNIRLIIFLVVNSDTVCLINDVHLNNCEFAYQYTSCFQRCLQFNSGRIFISKARFILPCLQKTNLYHRCVFLQLDLLQTQI